MKTFLCFLGVLTCRLVADGAILLQDNFSYPDGVLTNVSGGKWRHASGGLDQVDVAAGRVELTRSETEDVDAALATSFAASSSGVIYSRFRVRVLGTPAGANGNYFAHLDGGSARARVFVVTNESAPGHFRLGLAAGANSASSVWSQDLNTNESYMVITRLAVSNASVTLWVNPGTTNDMAVVAADVATASSVNRFTWRQDSGMGTLSVDDLVVATSFEEALHGNEMPSITSIVDRQIAAGGSVSIPVAIHDAESAAETLELSAHVVPENVVTASFAGTGSNRMVVVTASSNPSNTLATVTLLVTDGITTNRESFGVTVVPALLLSEAFNYPDGPLIAGGVQSWVHHSGSVTGQVLVTGGELLLSGGLTEDVSLLLPGGPFGTNSGTVLYASMRLRFHQLPSSSGDYLAHFNSSGARCRLFASTANAAPGRFRLGVANGASAVSGQLPIDLDTNTSYRAVLRYDPATAHSTLWVDPASEFEAGILAEDIATPTAVNAFAFRQDPGIGSVAIDDLKIGLTFESVVESPLPRLRIQNLPGAVRISWPATAVGFILEAADELGSAGWGNVPGTPIMVGQEFVVTNSIALQQFFRLRRP